MFFKHPYKNLPIKGKNKILNQSRNLFLIYSGRSQAFIYRRFGDIIFYFRKNDNIEPWMACQKQKSFIIIEDNFLYLVKDYLIIGIYCIQKDQYFLQ
jgi:hypothetical protein